jgi:hypothetical protein
MPDYDKMSAGPEMDALIAESVMGWTRINEPLSHWASRQLIWGPRGMPLYQSVESGGGPWFIPPEIAIADSPTGGVDVRVYSESDAWAVQVLDKLAADEVAGSIQLGATFYPTTIWRVDIYFAGPYERDGWVTAFAPTRALAICRAALMAVATEAPDESKQEATAV